MDDLVEFIDDTLEKNAIERDILVEELKEVIFNTLSIEIRKNSCRNIAKMNAALISGFNNFHSFY